MDEWMGREMAEGHLQGGHAVLRGQIRAYRAYHGMSQAVLADKAGISRSYLAGIESGAKIVNSRTTLERIADALDMTSSELTGGSLGTPEHAAIKPLRLVLTDVEIGEASIRKAPPWPEVRARVAAANERRHRADYLAQGTHLPSLIYDLHGHLSGPHRREALIGLTYALYAAGVTCRALGAGDLMLVAAGHIRDVTELLSEPEWTGMHAWMLAQAIGATAPDRAHRVASEAATNLWAELTRAEGWEMYGSLHLAASMAAILAGRSGEAWTHLGEAQETARRPGLTGRFGELWFGMPNTVIWESSLHVEAGNGPRAVELARATPLESLPPARIRRADMLIIMGRGMAQRPRDRMRAIELFCRAEKLAPQRVRTNPFVGEIVDDVVTRLRAVAVPEAVRSFAVRLGRFQR